MGDESWMRWVLAAGAAVLALIVLGLAIGTLVPRRTGEVVGGVDTEELQTACRLAGGDDAVLCQRVLRVEAALDDGQCTAARVQARPVLAQPEGDDLPGRLRAYTEARIEVRCGEDGVSGRGR